MKAEYKDAQNVLFETQHNVVEIRQRTFLGVDVFMGRHSLWTFGDVKKHKKLYSRSPLLDFFFDFQSNIMSFMTVVSVFIVDEYILVIA